MTRKRQLILLFNNQPGAVPSLTTGQNEKLSHESLLQMVTKLARRLLPPSEWDVRDFADEDMLRTSMWLNRTTVPQSHPDLAIVDMWFRHDDFTTRSIDDAHNARAVLIDVKTKFPNKRVCCILTATLPEPAADAYKHADAALDQFVPLAHTNVNGWDELFNVIKTEESCLLFGDVRNAQAPTHLSSIPDVAWHKRLKIGRPRSKYSRSREDIVIDGGGVTVNAPVILNQHIFEGVVIFQNCHVPHLQIRDCEFHKPVLFEHCTFDRSCVIASCMFFAHLNMQSCVFKRDLCIERCNFAPTTAEVTALAKTVSAVSTTRRVGPLKGATIFEHRLPWFSRLRFESRFVFRNNLGVPRERTHVHVLMFHRCRFEGRVDLALPNEPTKLVFYASSFRFGRHTDIRFPYIRSGGPSGVTTDVVQTRFRPFRNEGDPAFDQDAPDFDQKSLEMRFCLCDLAGRIVVREHPWPLDPLLVDKNEHTAAADGTSATNYLRYSTQYGLGLNLSGSTLSGSLNLRWLRVRWINCERITVLGGALFLNSSALRTDRFQRKGLRDILSLAPEIGRVVFDELVGYGDEQPRFSTLIHHSTRLMEMSSAPAPRVEMIQRIVQQYEDLRKACANASNAQEHEDYCHYKMMMYKGILHRALIRLPDLVRHRSLKRVSLLLAAAVLLVVVFVMWLCRRSNPTWMVAPAYIAMAVGGALVTTRGRVKQRFRGLVEWLVLRKMFGYLVYPSRIITTAILTVVGFAALYAGLAWIGSLLGPGESAFGTLHFNNTEAVPVDEKVLDTSARIVTYCCRCLSFSGVTFTTFGSGDVLPSGLLRVLSKVEAFVGALYFAMITAAMVRQVTRR